MHEGVEGAAEVGLPARAVPHIPPPDGEEGGGVVVHVQERNLTVVLLQNHDHGIEELICFG
eukprot:CAMPEP_0196587956 /NCGR_PEP_ID=MMETSP1081-20130531/59164_1 /TAXON_ID=36882 /ORGANISM="Pyramimonas amylifera, Strain CCMP720" /LENGTH=60 /DNA_ID=CAMNT_0041910305 /DNA_START=379 /DNA_END=557 /DNA_ORIENTATION=+